MTHARAHTHTHTHTVTHTHTHTHTSTHTHTHTHCMLKYYLTGIYLKCAWTFSKHALLILIMRRLDIVI